MTEELMARGYDEALGLMRACSTGDGFVASPSERRNYRRVWGRDGSIMSIAALLTADDGLIDTARRTLDTLARYQGPHGEIPSNVDPTTDRISYGGTTGRIDADLWFLIASGEYWCATGDDAFLERLLPVIENVRFLLGAWEINNRGLIYVPLTGDWADEYLHHGYVFYDELLYLQAQRALAAMHAEVHGGPDHALLEKMSRLRHLLRANYWMETEDQEGPLPADAYHEVLFGQGRKVAGHCAGVHWLPSFSPSGYGYRFDAFANVLASFLDVADDHQRKSVDTFIARELVRDDFPLLPAFHPVIKPVDEDWEDLQVMFSYTFKNRPYEYHNGGLWPMVTGFYVADLAQRGLEEEARRFLSAVHRANALEMDGEAWSFPEYVHGQKLTPGGTRQQGWSAAGAVIGRHALSGDRVLSIDHHEA